MANIEAVQRGIAQDEEVADVPVYQKNGDPYLAADGETPSTIGVVGSDSKRYQAARDQITRRLIRGRSSKLSPEDIRRNRIDQAAAAVVRWSGWEKDGKEWPVTLENVKALLSAEHILEQVEGGITGHADFFGTSSSS